MGRRPPLRFTRLDAAIVAVSIGLGILLAMVEPKRIEAVLGLSPSMQRLEQVLQAELAAGRLLEPRPATRFDQAVRSYMLSLGYAEPALAAATLGLALATFHHRAALARPGRRGRGVVTTGMAAMLIVARLGVEYPTRRVPWILRWYGPTFFTLIGPDLSQTVGAATLASWIVMALGGVARGRPGWHDRLGRLLDWAWLVALVGRTVFYYAYFL